MRRAWCSVAQSTTKCSEHVAGLVGQRELTIYLAAIDRPDFSRSRLSELQVAQHIHTGHLTLLPLSTEHSETSTQFTLSHSP